MKSCHVIAQHVWQHVRHFDPAVENQELDAVVDLKQALLDYSSNLIFKAQVHVSKVRADVFVFLNSSRRIISAAYVSHPLPPSQAKYSLMLTKRKKIKQSVCYLRRGDRVVGGGG
jgi:hypothetical protein